MSSSSDPLPGAQGDRSVDQPNQNGQSMTPTPQQPHLAHCCECLRLELEAAELRQRADLDRMRYEQTRCDLQNAMEAAERIVGHGRLGDALTNAESFLAKAFVHFERVVAAAELPSFR